MLDFLSTTQIEKWKHAQVQKSQVAIWRGTHVLVLSMHVCVYMYTNCKHVGVCMQYLLEIYYTGIMYYI